MDNELSLQEIKYKIMDAIDEISISPELETLYQSNWVAVCEIKDRISHELRVDKMSPELEELFGLYERKVRELTTIKIRDSDQLMLCLSEDEEIEEVC